MRNKGFFWVLTIILTAVCLYQLSFTWVSSKEENRAEKEAERRVQNLKKEAFQRKDSLRGIGFLPNNKQINFNNPEATDIAKAAFVNEILKEKSEKAVYPIFGNTFSEVKKRSLAFGLDLVGGVS